MTILISREVIGGQSSVISNQWSLIKKIVTCSGLRVASWKIRVWSLWPVTR